MVLEPFWVPFSIKSQSKNILFFERLLEPVWSHPGRLLGCLGALSGGLECYPGTTLQQFWHILKNEGSRCLSCLGRLLEGVLAHFGPIWNPKWNKKSLKKDLKNKYIFGLLLGAVLGPFWSSFWEQKQLKKGTKNEVFFLR